MSRVVVTGAGGFVGRWAVTALRARGHEVHAVSQRTSGMVDGVEWHAADLVDGAEARRLMLDLRAERLLHLAWVTEHGAYWSSADNGRWLDATKELVGGFRDGGGTRVVCAGTCAEYDWRAPELASGVCDELSTPTAPRTPYGEAKLAIGRWLMSLDRLSAATGRLFFLYGEGEDRRRLVPSVALALLKGERPRTGPGSIVRDFSHVSDVGAALAALLSSEVRGAVNIASGVGTTIGEIARAIAGHVGAPDGVDIGALPGKADDPPRLVGSVARLRSEVGYRPKVDLDAGIQRTVAWWRAARDGELTIHGAAHAR